jgi:hypothetical protein
MWFREVIDLYSENHKRHVSTVGGKMLSNKVTAVAQCSSHCALRRSAIAQVIDHKQTGSHCPI